MAAIPPLVMIIGYGFIGRNHADKVRHLEEQGKAKLACIVDIDPTRFATDLKVPTYLSVERAFRETLPHIVAICSNTQTHASILEEIHKLSKECDRMVHILVEKPLADNIDEGASVRELYSEYKGCISGGYLFRHSPTVQKVIEFLNQHHLLITGISTISQKDRMKKGPLRPSAGVHVDEATHFFDLAIYILSQLKIQVDGVTILSSSFKRQSEVGQIVDQEKQTALYGSGPRLDPIAEVEYKIDINGIELEGFSSFVRDPQRREINLRLNDGTTLFLEFDLQTGDRFSKISSTQEKQCLWEEKVDKLMFEWEAFIKYCTTGQPFLEQQTLDEMLFDIRLTEALGEEHSQPVRIQKLN